MHRKVLPNARSTVAKVALVALVSVALTTSSLSASASAPTSQAVNPGDLIQTAINNVAPGGVVTIAPGTYEEELYIEKSVTLRGDGPVGSVVIKQPVVSNPGNPNVRRLIDIHMTSNVTLDNLTMDGSARVAANGMQSTGVDANSVDGLTLNNVTAKGFAHNGITITGKYLDSSTTHSQNVSFNTVSVINNGWAGIALYSLSSQGVNSDISGVTFTGTTTVTNNVRGIQFGDPGDTHGEQGANNGPVSLGVAAFSANTKNVTRSDSSVVQLDRASTVDGHAVRSSDFAAGTLTLVPSTSTSSTVSVSPSGAALTGDAVTVTGTVTPTAAVGTIEIFDGLTSLGSGAAVNGGFTVSSTTLAPGSHNFSATFTPTSAQDYQASTSASASFSVNEKLAKPVDPPVTSTVELTTAIDKGTIPVVTSSFVPSSQTVSNPLTNLDVSKPFSGALPWANTQDSFVDVYAYSSPVFVGTFPVINGQVQMSGMNLSALQAGGHHLVFQGQTSRAISAMAITVAAIHLPIVGG